VGLFNAQEMIEHVSPDELLRQFFAHIENGQFEEMYGFLNAVSQENISIEDFIQRNRSIYEGIGARNISLTINNIYEMEDRPGRKIVEYSLWMDTVAGEISHDQTAIFLLNENNEYSLLWTSRMIFPELGDNNRVRVSILPAQRGRIFDRNGEMLAGPGTASAVGFVPGRTRREEIIVPIVDAPIINDRNYLGDDDNYSEDLLYEFSEDELLDSQADIQGIPSEPENETVFIYNEDDIARVAELLEMTPEAVIRRLNASYVRDDTFVQLRLILRDAQDLIDELLTVQGILITTAHVRYYPLGRSAAHLVGYVQSINAEELEERRNDGYHMNSVIGRAGIERIFEDTLRARDGREIFIVDENGNRSTTLVRIEPINGNDVRLTIDALIQRQLYEVFSDDMSASVATNPITGEVLALVSSPSYDPNDFVRGMTPSVWNGLNEDENLPMFNRFRATFSPGSTMKALTAAIGIINPLEDFGRSGRRWQLDESRGGFFVTTVREYDGHANINNAMAFSDNIYFAKAALRIGEETFANGLRNLGFGERIPFEYGLFSSITSRTGGFSSDILLADSGYGQGEILINPVHLAAIYGAFLTEGNVLEPRLVLDNAHTGRMGEQLAEQATSPPQMWIPNAFSSETARVVLDSLVFSVEHGTGQGARIPGMTLAGKTGTAEIKLTQDDDTGRELGWFVLLTADEDIANPLLVVSMVEDVQGRGGSGYVVTRVRRIFEWR